MVVGLLGALGLFRSQERAGGGAGADSWVKKVKCDKGQTLSDALKKAKPGDTLQVTGTCHERVTISTYLKAIGIRFTARLDPPGRQFLPQLIDDLLAYMARQLAYYRVRIPSPQLAGNHAGVKSLQCVEWPSWVFPWPSSASRYPKTPATGSNHCDNLSHAVESGASHPTYVPSDATGSLDNLLGDGAQIQD